MTSPKQYQAFDAYKRIVQRILHDAGWSHRGIFKAFSLFKIADAFASGETAAMFANRVDTDAPLGMAS